jgi:hypothetical protein
MSTRSFHIMRKNRSGAAGFPSPIATVVGVNLIIDRINNRRRGDKAGAVRAVRRDAEKKEWVSQ